MASRKSWHSPAFTRLFLYGDFKRELKQFCQLYGIEPVVV